MSLRILPVVETTLEIRQRGCATLFVIRYPHDEATAIPRVVGVFSFWSSHLSMHMAMQPCSDEFKRSPLEVFAHRVKHWSVICVMSSCGAFAWTCSCSYSGMSERSRENIISIIVTIIRESRTREQLCCSRTTVFRGHVLLWARHCFF